MFVAVESIEDRALLQTSQCHWHVVVASRTDHDAVTLHRDSPRLVGLGPGVPVKYALGGLCVRDNEGQVVGVGLELVDPHTVF